MDAGARGRRTLRESALYWADFVSRCIAQRLDPDRFRQFVPLIHAKHPLTPVLLADLFIKPQPSNDVSLDPRIPPYVQALSQLGYVDAPSILRALFRYSSLHALLPRPPDGDSAAAGHVRPRLWRSSSWAEEVMFYHVIKTVVEGSAFRDARAALVLVRILCKWMDLFTSAFSVFTADVLGQVQNSRVRDEMDVAHAAFVPLLLRLVETPSLVKAISRPFARAIRKELSHSLNSFMHTMQHAPGFVERFEVFRTKILGRLDPADKKKQAAAHSAMDELLDPAVGLEKFVIPDMSIPNTRAGLYVYLNAALAGRPVIDDGVLLSLLHNRYQVLLPFPHLYEAKPLTVGRKQGDTQSGAVDLILASFDILANAVFRKEAARDAHLLRSFLTNKVPLLLCKLFPPQLSTASSELCITEALNQVDTSVFPTASLMFDKSQSNNPYTENVREEFCMACALHGFVQREHVERILGETSMSYESSVEKYSKDKLVQGCLSDPDKIQGLVRELDRMDGNVGAVCQALVKLMRQLCGSKETMSLKLLCGQLVQKPQSLDILALFEKLPAILEPLCQLLDGWRYDEDQGEYQPIYEEFGAILLLVLAYACRYNLAAADIGLTSPDSCVAKILSRGHVGRRLSELSEQETGHVGGWIHGLFDSETGGLGGDLMSSCPPQDFYLLVATIFQNMVVGYTHGYLNEESLRSGIEYMVDTFLLPSLVPAIQFLADYLWVEQKEQKSIVKVLRLMLLPSSISSEASTMLSSVKNVVAKPLESALRSYQRKNPDNADVEALLRALKDSVALSRRSGGAEQGEVETWATSSSSGLAGAVRHTVQALVQWSMHHGVNVMPTPYTHRQVIAACRMAGAGTVLRVLVEEMRQQGQTGAAGVACDVAAALVCAPDVTRGAEAPLREALRAEAEGWRTLHRKDAALAETTVRLHRRVEAHMAARAMLPAPLDANGLGEAMAVDSVGLNMGMAAMSSDLRLGRPDAAGDGDLFGNMEAGLDMFHGWDGMKL